MLVFDLKKKTEQKNSCVIFLFFSIEAKQVFECFDKKYEGKVDVHYIGDMLRSLNLAVTNAECEKRGQTPKPGAACLHIRNCGPQMKMFLINFVRLNLRHQNDKCGRIFSHLLGILQNAR